MKLTADFTDDLKPDELEELVLLSRERQVPMGKLLLNAARTLVRGNREPGTANREQPKAA